MTNAILALDLGTTTGWALRRFDGIIQTGTLTLRPGRFEGGGMRFVKFTRWLDEIGAHLGVGEILEDGRAKYQAKGLVYFEEVRRHRGVDAAHAYGGYLASLTAWCEARRVPYEGIPVGTIKLASTGKGNASKEMMIQAAHKRGYMPADDNEADAIALLYMMINPH